MILPRPPRLLPRTTGYYTVLPQYADLLRSVGLTDAMSIFDNKRIVPWRSIRERENCVLDHDEGRLHVKRNKIGFDGIDDEADRIGLLKTAGIKTVPLVGHGRLNDGRGFLISDDLAHHADSEKLLAGGTPFETLLQPTAALAGQLHRAKLHHRDLYLCHFYADLTTDPPDMVLMDAGRVAKLPRWFARRWVVKDIGEFVYSLRQSFVDASPEVADSAVASWLDAYAEQAARPLTRSFCRAVERKAAAISRHHTRLQRRQPERGVSIETLDRQDNA